MKFVDSVVELGAVETTALTIAHRRWLESSRPNRLFSDPFAAAFVVAAGEIGIAASKLPSAPADYFAVRTRFFDDYLLDACAAGCRQVVLLAAGLDARAYRLDWPPGVRVFEIDLDSMLRFKDRVLAPSGIEPRSDRVAIAADLRGDWGALLRDAGFEDVPTAWLAEGLLFYFDDAEARRLIGTASSLSAAGSMLGIEHVDTAMFEAMRPVVNALAERGSPWRSSIDDPATWLRELGWEADVVDHETAGARLARPLGGPTKSEAKAWLVSATRRLHR